MNGTALRAGESTSCGCYNHDVITKFGNAVYKEKLYAIWNGMKQRCSNPNLKEYPNYGGRGIRVCSEWENDYAAFKAWAHKNGYRPGLWLDRVNNDGNYCPENCEWKTPKQQQRNKRTNVVVEIGGVKKCLTDWAEESGIPFTTLSRRMKLGWETERLLSPVDHKYSHSEAIRAAITITKLPPEDGQMSFEEA